MDKSGIDISFMLTKEQRDAGFKTKTVKGTTIEIYFGKACIASFGANLVTVEMIREVVTSYQKNIPQEPTKEG
jgi:hypothetical protein